MLLAAENFRPIILIMYILLFAMEFFLIILLFTKYKYPFEETLKIIPDITINKAANFTNILHNYFEDIFLRFIGDFDLIRKHMSLINDFKEFNQFIYDTNLIINNDDLSSNENLKKFYKDGNFKYSYDYTFDKSNIDNNNQINETQDNIIDEKFHPELGMISYYSANNSYDINENKTRVIVYLTTIFKSLYTRNIILKKNQNEYLRWIIINGSEVFTYPPDFYYNSLVYSNNQRNPLCNGKDYINKFPICTGLEKKFTANNPTVIYVTSINDVLGYDICTLIPFMENSNEVKRVIICAEVNIKPALHRLFLADYAFLQNNLPIFDNPSPKKSIRSSSRSSSSKSLLQSHFTYYFLASPMLLMGCEEYCVGLEPVVSFCGNPEYDIQTLSKTYSNETYGDYQLPTEGKISNVKLFNYLYLNVFYVYEGGEKGIKGMFEYLKEEYNELINTVLNLINSGTNSTIFNFNITNCRKDLYNNNTICEKEYVYFYFERLYVNDYKIDESTLNKYNFDDSDKIQMNVGYLLVSIKFDNIYFHEIINKIYRKKMLRICIFNFLLSFILIFLFGRLVKILTYKLLDERLIEYKKNIEFIKKFLSKEEITQYIDSKCNNNITDNDSYKLKKIFSNDEDISCNKEIKEIENLYNYQKKMMLLNRALIYNSHLTNDYFFSLLENMHDSKEKIFFEMLIGFSLYKAGKFTDSRKLINDLLHKIRENEINIENQNENTMEQMSDLIKRTCDASYLNEFSNFKGINEDALPLINIKIFKQKILYLYGMILYRMVKDKLKGKIINNKALNDYTLNKLTKQENKKTLELTCIHLLYKTIEIFDDVKSINEMLGLNKIKQIYSLIMIAKCYILLNNYREALKNLFEALSIFKAINRIFYLSENDFDEKFILLMQTIIFQTIVFYIAKAALIHSKNNAACWILVKQFETSPFLLINLHWKVIYTLLNSLSPIEKNLYKKNKYILDNTKKFYYKILSRLVAKREKTILDIIKRQYTSNNNSNANSNTNSSLKRDNSLNNKSINKYRISSKAANRYNLDSGKQSLSSSLNQSFFSKYTMIFNKEITICVNERYLNLKNGLELKYVLCKFLTKYFRGRENDKYAYMQFAITGKISVYIKHKNLYDFIKELNNNKYAFVCENNNIGKHSRNNKFTELRRIIEFIVKSVPTPSLPFDRLFLLFTPINDIRFSSIRECVSSVQELNGLNFSLYLFVPDNDIRTEKLENVTEFLGGICDRALVQLKGHKLLAQIFGYLGDRDKEGSMNDFDFSAIEFVV